MLIKKLTLFSSVLLLSLGLAACSGNDEAQEEKMPVGEDTENLVENEDSMMDLEPHEPVAIVNGKEILQQELTDQYEQIKLSYLQQGVEIDRENEVVIKNYVLDQLVNTTLILQAAEKGGFSPSNEEVQEQLDQIKEQYGSEEELNEILEQNNLTLAKLEEEVKIQLTINQYLESEIKEPSVSQEEIIERYEQYKQQTDEMPELEEVEGLLAEEIKQEKNQASIGELVDKLKQASEINILI
ncbi:MAG: SurA N-terminal domain-containing protein [Anaerobacillus sp.]|uniref:SurA N-terminal domain-containing protein n=1 Tax=Anaerobacillus sp. TaxID=1872506 RepID=UPI0039188BEE